YADDFSATGVSRNDYEMVLHWNFADAEAFSYEKMKKILEVEEKYRDTLGFSVKEGLKEMMARRMPFYPGAYVCVLLSLLLFFLRPKAFGIPLLLAAEMVCVFLGFHWIRRYVYRVEFCMLFSAAAVLFHFLREDGLSFWERVCGWLKKKRGEGKILFCRHNKGRNENTGAGHSLPGSSAEGNQSVRIMGNICSIPALFLSVLLPIYGIIGFFPEKTFAQMAGPEEYRTYIDELFFYSWNYDARKYYSEVRYGELRKDFLAEAEEHPENIYFLDFDTTIQSLYFDFPPFFSARDLFPANLVFLGGITVNHPVWQGLEKRLGVKSLLDALPEKNVYYVCSAAPERMLEYFHEHVNRDMEMVLYKELDGYQIWSFRQRPARAE
ncbi:MAG: hypothetical protein IKN57_08485, partial [Parasporobacterium sp.]|nr:hypothetical protein [Parasporobacterium sp.]